MQQSVGSGERRLTLLFGAALFVSAGLLFLVQPMFAKELLPTLGGAPAVWNTCVVFYELILLTGYLYVFYLRKLATPRAQTYIHLALVLLVLAFLPLRVHAAFAVPESNTAVVWVLTTLLLSLGLPLIVLSATSPLLQSWFGATTHERSHDPYFLYAASNAGSLLGLLIYPFALEPLLGLHAQGLIWTAGYVALVILLAATALIFWRSATPPAEPTDATAVEPVTRARKIRWLVLAFIPSSLMLSATTYISTAVAPLPLLWVVPLALYLITLIIAFSAGVNARLARLRRISPLVVLPLIVILATRTELAAPLLVLIHLTAFFFVALTCHSLLAADRPDKTYLTQYYLWLAAGGAIGGLFSAIIAPLVFRTVFEYPLVLILAAYFVRETPSDAQPSKVWDFYLPLGMGAALALFISFSVKSATPQAPTTKMLIAFSFAALIALLAFRRPLGFACSVASLVLCGVLYQATIENTLFVERNFFGINEVRGAGPFHFLFHGRTVHGVEDMRAANRSTPQSYYSRSGPLGQLFAARADVLQHGSMAVVGLGAGSSLCYREPGQRWTIYEIDPAVDRIARDPRLFAYIASCAPDVPTVLGDARVSLGKAPDQAYDLMILDAYSADYVPVHLITREALELYLRKLQPNGILAFHITNRWFELQWVLEPLARDLGLSCYVEHERYIKVADAQMGKYPSDWLVLARNDSDLGALTQDPRWQSCPPTSFRLWTDDYSSLVTAIPIRFSIGTQ